MGNRDFVVDVPNSPHLHHPPPLHPPRAPSPPLVLYDNQNKFAQIHPDPENDPWIPKTNDKVYDLKLRI